MTEYVYRVTAERTEHSHTTRRLKRTLRNRRAVAQIIAANESLGARPPTTWRPNGTPDRRERITIERALISDWEVITPEQLKENPPCQK